MIALLFLGFGIMALMEIPGLIQKQWWRELIGFFIFWSAGFILSIMMSMGITLPPVSTIINNSVIRILGI